MLRYTVEDMTCGHCEQAVTRAISTLDARAEVTVDLPAKLVEVKTSASPGSVVAAMREAGYTPREVRP